MATLFELYDDAILAIVGQMDNIGTVLRFARTCKRFRALVNNLWPKLIGRAKYWSSSGGALQSFEFYDYYVLFSDGGPPPSQFPCERICYAEEFYTFGPESKIKIYIFYIGIKICSFYITFDSDTMSIKILDRDGNYSLMMGFLDRVLGQARIAPELIGLLRAAILVI